jgi:hypothetical protein
VSGRKDRDRDDALLVAAAQREAIDRAVAAGLSGAQWRVFSAVLWYTTSWTKLWDRVTHDQIGARAGLAVEADGKTLTEASRRNLRRYVRDLAEAGVITYEPGRGREEGGGGLPSKVGIPPASKGVQADPLSEASKGVEADPLSGGQRGLDQARKGGKNGADKGVEVYPPPVNYPDKDPGGTRAHAREGSTVSEPASPPPTAFEGQKDEDQTRSVYERAYYRKTRRWPTKPIEALDFGFQKTILVPLMREIEEEDRERARAERDAAEAAVAAQLEELRHDAKTASARDVAERVVGLERAGIVLPAYDIEELAHVDVQCPDLSIREIREKAIAGDHAGYNAWRTARDAALTELRDAIEAARAHDEDQDQDARPRLRAVG